MNRFIESFYWGESSNPSPTGYDLYHCNQLSRSCKNDEVRSRSLQ